jgi:hypothetical protein
MAFCHAEIMINGNPFLVLYRVNVRVLADVSRYMLPPSSGSKCVRCRSLVYVLLQESENEQRRKGTVGIGALSGPTEAHEVEVADCTAQCSYWLRRGTNPHPAALPLHIHRRQTPFSRQRGCYVRTIASMAQWRNKSLVVSFKGLDAKTN